MNYKEKIKLKLKQLVTNLQEASNGGVTYVWEGELNYGTEVFINVEGEWVLAQTGEFNVDGHDYVVEGGVITTIDGKPKPEEEPVEPVAEPVEPVVEAEAEPEEEPVEPVVEVEPEEEPKLKELVEQLTKRVEVLEASYEKMLEIVKTIKMSSITPKAPEQLEGAARFFKYQK